jgi:hypothetical protein
MLFSRAGMVMPRRPGGWLDYCREEPAVSSENGAAAWAADQACKLAKRIGVGVRFKLEHW